MLPNLEFTKKALELLPRIYHLAKNLPRDEFDLRTQLCRAAKSISAQIAEGFAKKSSQVEFKRYLLMSLGSSDEAITHLRQIEILIPSLKTQASDLINEYVAESKQINSLIKKIRNPISEV